MAHELGVGRAVAVEDERDVAPVEVLVDAQDEQRLIIVLDGTHLYQNRGAWGPRHDDYKEWWPPYRFRWEGPLRDAAGP